MLLYALLLLAIAGFSLASINDVNDMTYEVLIFITQAARDCTIRAKDVMMNARGVQIPVNPVLEQKHNCTGHGLLYCRVGHPCNGGYHELFFNGLLYGVVGTSIQHLRTHMSSFKRFYFEMEFTGDRYTMDSLAIKPDAHDEIHYIPFSKNNINYTNADGSKMNR